jgi:hypothetical protein
VTPVPSAPPNSWWTVDELAVGATGGLALYYRVGRRKPIRDDEGRWLRDAAGRNALEAFGALPLKNMLRRLREVEEAWLATDQAVRARMLEADPDHLQERWLKALAELTAFVRRFGPLGFAWAQTFEVTNPEADRALGPAKPRRRWQAVLPTPGVSLGRVRQIRSEPRSPWTDRVAIGDDSVPHDFLGADKGPLMGHHDDLWRAIRLVSVLGDENPDPFAIRDAAGALPRAEGYDIRDKGVRDPVDVRWIEAMRTPSHSRLRGWSPFEDHPTKVKWTIAGKLILADYLTAQLAWTRIEAGLDSTGIIRTRWTPGSLLEIIYLQLLEHVEERLSFGIGTCERCAGPILRTRVAEGTRNRSHRGCAAVVRKRRQRERERLAATRGRS